MKKLALSIIALGMVAGGPLSCSTQPKTEEARSSLSGDVSNALANFRDKDPEVQAELDKAAGYAVLPDVGKGGAGVGAAYGRGEVFEGGNKIGYCALSEGTVGAQLGGQRFSELIIFKDRAALDRFKQGGYTFAANASAVAIRPGVARTANYRDGVAVFVHVKSGLMAEASIGGQRIRFEPLSSNGGSGG
jgi:lipid-binding SYLF domain-containing protein